MIDALARLALTGTSRQPNAAIRANLPTDALLGALAGEPPERRLLLAAGAAALYRSAGQPVALAPTGHFAAAAADARPPCSPKAARLLADLVRDGHADLAGEAAQLLDRGGRRLPHDILPAVLAVTDMHLRKALRPILGERGRWLASFNQRWQWAVSKTDELPASLSDLETVWNEGMLAARIAVLARLHQAQPQRARDWLSQVWAKEKAEPRADLLAAFGASLTAEDEPFIEGLLEDRSMVVRAQAARLLARIPGSRLSQQMIARADAMLAYEAPKVGMLSKLKALAGGTGGKLIVTPPQEIDAAWERDGIPAKPPQGVGKRAYWLRLVLSLVPLSHWRQRLGAAPEALLSAARATEWWETLVPAWTEAAQSFADADWRMALWDFWLELLGGDGKVGTDRQVLAAGLPAMLRAMPRGDAEACLLAAFKSSPSIGNVTLTECLRDLQRPWSAELAERCLSRLRQEAAAGVRATLRESAAGMLPIAARGVPPECFVQALAPWPELPGDGYTDKVWTREIAAFIETVQLRKTLIEEIRS